MSKVYIVIGSEDGIVGVYSSRKKARVVATDYVIGEQEHSTDIVVYTTKWNECFSSATTKNRAEIRIEALI